MAKYVDSKCRLCRREGAKLFLKGDRCFTEKCGFTKRSYAPGAHGVSRKKLSNYGVQLREKQKTKRVYGLLEKQFRSTYDRAEHMRGITGENLLMLLELRLDNVVFRLGFGRSRAEARQLVNHGHFLVNGKKVDIPSYTVEVNDKISVREKSRKTDTFKDFIERNKGIPSWLTLDSVNYEGQVISKPARENIDISINETLIVELYSK